MTKEEVISKKAVMQVLAELGYGDEENGAEPEYMSALADVAKEVIAIEALKEEPCKDAISLEDVFEIMGNLLSIPYDFDRNITETDVKKAMDDIRELKPVQPKAEWIPISKKLPDAQIDSDKDFSDWVQVSIQVNAHQTFVCSAYYCFSEKKWYMERMCCGKVVAWMPLPEPYKESEDKK